MFLSILEIFLNYAIGNVKGKGIYELLGIKYAFNNDMIHNILIPLKVDISQHSY